MEVNKLEGTQLILNKIHSTKKVHDVNGNEYVLNSNIDREEGNFLEKLVVENGFKSSIEIGCAYGISSLHICGALKRSGAQHTIIDPFQATEWNNVGIDQLRKAGVSNFKLIEKYSEIALPNLLQEGASYDFAFVDGWHTFDHTLLDMFYLNRMLELGGIMVIDDVGMKGVERAVNYFLNYPAYEFVGGIKSKTTPGRDLFTRYIIPSIKSMAKVVPSKVREEVFSAKLNNNSITGYSMVALRKVKEDNRPWNWYSNF